LAHGNDGRRWVFSAGLAGTLPEGSIFDVSIHDPIANLFHIPRHDISSGHHRELRSAAMKLWAKIARA
jgi:hypothetical protein